MRKLIDPAQVKTTDNQSNSAGGVGHSTKHESARKHISGSAQYIDDMPVLPNMLYVATGYSCHAHAIVKSVDLSAVKQAIGVVDVITHTDIPGHNDVGPVYGGDPLLAEHKVEYIGQPIFAVAATSLHAAKKAVKLAKIEYQILPAQLTVEEALSAESFVLPTHTMQIGDSEAALTNAQHKLNGQIYVKGQEHFYLEGQISQAWPTEDGGIHVITSTQHPSEIQKLIAEILSIPLHLVVSEVRRMGGAFGGKESQAAALACMAALFANRLNRPIRYKMPRQDDMIQTGKRHDFDNKWQAGFDDSGLLQGVNFELSAKCGYSPDLSEGIVDRAMFHADNAYYLGNAVIKGHRCKTHTVSNTAFRGFGGPQGMMAIETLMDDIACYLGKDPLDVRKTNLYQADRTTTHYGQEVEQQVLPELIEQLETSSNYRIRREQITAFNATNPYVKKGLALTPVKFGISFTVKHLNQAGALLQIYTDGTMLINHGGTEMGQGLYTKIQQVVASAFGVTVNRVNVSSTRTDKVPNTSPTAASSGTDLNGMAAQNACDIIKSSLIEFAIEHYSTQGLTLTNNDICFENDLVLIGQQTIPFGEFIKLAYMNRVPLFAAGHYKTPKIYYDRETAKGQPFLYYANGAAVSEVSVDTLTGEYKVEQVDILHDVGQSLNPALDIGQIEGGFVQGMGWLTTEDLSWDDSGKLISNSPANYKIPTAFDVPEKLKVDLYQQHNTEVTIHSSKAVGEPPLMLAISVWAALRDACASTTSHKFIPRLDTPATPERIFWALKECQDYLHTGTSRVQGSEKEQVN
ncbi:xanthine dehydrogenase molybdopterin binding subunit [Paraglaciecola aquimarina]|uniref:Xanthine dehydrogenase molybdopterin binding subunit n=1 Tax=Paraglaciecola algarum TaxID=3050085 RepID=A0ABS9D723_9ALTE|nr:xanthine dehydrogenase molybdopterin binding subunit [Paraglaciecola sp. G1-23]MCF2948710.1 xanthine dehydrogenase molybdopterin binding subunit [Paraglaciecola sp. G1-23]